MDSQPTETSDLDAQKSLVCMIPKLPKAISYRFRNALDHIDRAQALLPIDREMASFRAITGEEESATALMMAIQSKGYPDAGKFNLRNHMHKAAVMACVISMAPKLEPVLKEFQLIFDFEKCRIDLKVPLSNFDIEGGENYGLQFVEPLGFVHGKEGGGESDIFNTALESLAAGQGYEHARQFIAKRANDRNTLLYASDAGMPASKATRQALENRKNRSLILLSLAIMVLQAKGHQPMVKQAIPAFLRVIGKAEKTT
ncbi:hypothetical protein [Altererythrobacter sp. MF3-039]|uniref:hypothetical protein n=1 Tax=Altererythrobacter sp. MF3-039 TaxID=3252901 RepID=UPI00390C74C8